MPDSTLTKAVNGSQTLPKKWEEPLQNHILEMNRELFENLAIWITRNEKEYDICVCVESAIDEYISTK